MSKTPTSFSCAADAADPIAAELATLLFRIFIHVTDTDKEITAYEVQRFHRLIGDTRWTSNPALQSALGLLRQQYASLWAAYQSGTLAVDLETISGQLDATWFSAGEDAPAWRRSLRDFVEKIGQTGSPALARMGVIGATVSKTTARSRIDGLLATARPAPDTVPGVGGAASLWPAAACCDQDVAPWSAGRLDVRCAGVVLEAADVKTYLFCAVPHRPFRYKPGQFITLELQIDDRTVRRSYTISSSPSRPNLLAITVKRVPDGLVSNWLFDNMAEGMPITLSGPNGAFSCLNHPAERLLLISGGSGVTPMMSMLRWLADTQSPADVVFLNNVRTPGDVIFERELQHLSAQMGRRLRLAIIPGMVSSGQAWNGLTGSLNDDILQTIAPDFLEREVFVCGPAGYMTMVKNMLQQLNFPMRRHHEEAFGAAAPQRAPGVGAVAPSGDIPRGSAVPAPEKVAVPPPRAWAPIARGGTAITALASAMPAASAQRQTQASVSLMRSGKTFICGAGETILEAARRQGTELPSQCCAGLCGTCKVLKTGGQVTMDGQEALSREDLAQGWVLPCVARSTGHVTLDA